MQAPYVADVDLDALLDPTAPAWRAADGETLKLMGTPLGLQPTAAVQVAWAGKPIGAVGRVTVSALHNGEVLAFQLGWDDPSENGALSDTTAFPDAVAILLPSVPKAPLMTMGAPGAAVNAWYWRADEPESARNVVAEGLGTTRTLDDQLVRGRGAWKEGRWGVVIARALRVATDAPVAQLEPGAATGFGVAVWEGSHGERAGIKAFSPAWAELRLAPASGR
jgi:DMSO reductase family type II enzyme heme b subunit